MATFTDCTHDSDIATLRAATDAFMTDYTDGECTCLDGNKSILFVPPGENFYLVGSNRPSIEQPTLTAQSILDLIDELVTPDMFLYDDAVQVNDRYSQIRTRIAESGIPHPDTNVTISMFPQTRDISADTPRVGAYFDVGRQEFVAYTALEQPLFEDDDHTGSSTSRPSELGYFDADTQLMVAYTAFNQLLSIHGDEDEVLPRIHRACEDFEDWGDQVIVQELASLSTNYGSVTAEVPSTDNSPLYELEGNTIPLTASNLRQLHSNNPGHGALSTSKPLLSPIVEESEPSSPGSSIAFAHSRGYIKPLSTRRESFLSVSTSPLSSRSLSRTSSRVSTPSSSWLDTFQTSPSLMLSKIIDTVFASEVWHATPNFTITPRGHSSLDGGVHNPDGVRVRISWVS